jgi:hypothetical protein
MAPQTFLAFDFGLKRTGVAGQQPDPHSVAAGTIAARGVARSRWSGAHREWQPMHWWSACHFTPIAPATIIPARAKFARRLP